MFHPAVHLTADALLLQPLLDAQLDGGKEFLVGSRALGHLVLDLLVPHRVQVAKGQVLQLPFELLHT